jgi:hypothetical protein
LERFPEGDASKEPVSKIGRQREIYSFVDELNPKRRVFNCFLCIARYSFHLTTSDLRPLRLGDWGAAMHIDWHLVVDLLKAWAWPIATLLVVFLLRRPLAELVAQIARRARKLSVYQVSIELATVPELSSTWRAGAADVRQLTDVMVFDSDSESLFKELLKPGQADYAVVDLGDGRRWLTSRLFIFALVLGRIRGLRAFVFVETSSVTRKRFLGMATVSDVHLALGAQYPWLEEAQLRAAASQYPNPDPKKAFRSSKQLPSIFDPSRVSHFVKDFISVIQRHSLPPPDELSSHLEVGTSPGTWERTRWIDGEGLERDLAGCLSYSYCEEALDQSRALLVNAIVRRKGDFVALVDRERRFLRLIDRRAVLESLALERDPIMKGNGDASS